MTRRSTRTTTVFSPLSLTTTPCKTRLGIIPPLCRRSFGRRAALAQDQLQPRDITAHLPPPRRVFQLPARLLKAQIECLLAQLQQLVAQLVVGLEAQVGSLHSAIPRPRARRSGCGSATWPPPVPAPP